MIILGIDPGSRRMGWGVIEAVGSRLAHLGSGTLVPAAGPLTARLVEISRALEHLLARFVPEEAAVEEVFHAKNSQSALTLGQARGVALAMVGRATVPIAEYSASQIKQAATGRGRADKGQVQAMVCSLLALPEPTGFDASDALAAALCHALRRT